MPKRGKYRTRVEMWVHTGFFVCAAAGLGIVAAGSVVSAWHMYERLHAATIDADAAAAQLGVLSAQADRTKGDIEQLSTERGVEAALRERYGVVREGEGVIQIVRTDPSTTNVAADSSRGVLSRVIHTLWPW